MTILTREQILQADDLIKETVPVPEWGGEVIVRSLTGFERDAFEAGTIKENGRERKRNLVNIRARLIAKCVVSEDGKSLFSDADVQELGRKNAAPLDRLFSVAMRLSGMSPDDVEELAKNSESRQSENSGFDLP